MRHNFTDEQKQAIDDYVSKNNKKVKVKDMVLPLSNRLNKPINMTVIALSKYRLGLHPLTDCADRFIMEHKDDMITLHEMQDMAFKEFNIPKVMLRERCDVLGLMPEIVEKSKKIQVDRCQKTKRIKQGLEINDAMSDWSFLNRVWATTENRNVKERMM